MTGWLVAYTKIKKSGKKVDKFEVFLDGKEGFSHRELAKKRFRELLKKDNVYSANVCHIKDSSEPHYLDIHYEGIIKQKIA